MTNLSTMSIRFPEYQDTLPTVLALRAYNLKNIKAGDLISVTGVGAFNDRQGGDYVWDPLSDLAEDGVNVVRPNTSTTGRWLKIVGDVASLVQDSLGQSQVVAPSQNAVGQALIPITSKLATFVTVKDFGAKGDGVADDSAAIQAALDYVGSTGGGTVIVPKTTGRYRITDTIRIPAYVTLQGDCPAAYAFNVGNINSSAIVADFADKNKWVIEAKTTKASDGSFYGYNDRVSGSLSSCNPSYNVGVKDLGIVSQGTIPFGGLRIHGSPGALIDNVVVHRVGCGIFVNYSFDVRCRAHVLSHYYGFVGWDDVNASSFNLYVGQDYSIPQTVPNDYRMAFIAALDGAPQGAFAMATNSHTTRPFGMVFGSTSSLSVNNDLQFTSERFGGGLFLINTSGLEVTRCYLEGDVGQMAYGIAAANSSFAFRSLHAYMSGTGALFDLGAAINGVVSPGGILNPASFGTGPWQGDTSKLVVHDTVPTPGGPLQPDPPRTNVIHPDIPGPWLTPTDWANGWGPSSGSAVRYRLNRGKLELRGTITGGSYGATAFTVPAGFRPAYDVGLSAPLRGTLGISATGNVTPYPEGATIGLDGLSVSLD